MPDVLFLAASAGALLVSLWLALDDDLDEGPGAGEW